MEHITFYLQPLERPLAVHIKERLERHITPEVHGCLPSRLKDTKTPSTAMRLAGSYFRYLTCGDKTEEKTCKNSMQAEINSLIEYEGEQQGALLAKTIIETVDKACSEIAGIKVTHTHR